MFAGASASIVRAMTRAILSHPTSHRSTRRGIHDRINPTGDSNHAATLLGRGSSFGQGDDHGHHRRDSSNKLIFATILLAPKVVSVVGCEDGRFGVLNDRVPFPRAFSTPYPTSDASMKRGLAFNTLGSPERRGRRIPTDSCSFLWLKKLPLAAGPLHPPRHRLVLAISA